MHMYIIYMCDVCIACVCMCACIRQCVCVCVDGWDTLLSGVSGVRLCSPACLRVWVGARMCVCVGGGGTLHMVLPALHSAAGSLHMQSCAYILASMLPPFRFDRPRAPPSTPPPSSSFFCSVLLANNGLAAVKFMRSVRSWASQALGNARAVSFLAMATPNDMRISAEHIALADQFVEVPGGSNNNNYANVSLIVQIAERAGVDAVWPGW